MDFLLKSERILLLLIESLFLLYHLVSYKFKINIVVLLLILVRFIRNKISKNNRVVPFKNNRTVNPMVIS